MPFNPAARGKSGRRLPHSSNCSWCLADAAARNETRLEEQACPVAKAPSPPLQSCHSFFSFEEVRTAMLEKALPSKVRVWVWVWVWGGVELGVELRVELRVELGAGSGVGLRARVEVRVGARGKS